MIVGDRVKLSAEGLKSFPRPKKGIGASDLRGIVRNADGRLAAGCVRIKWDHRKDLETIARCFVEVDAKD